jgi:putative flippase GtrA
VSTIQSPPERRPGAAARLASSTRHHTRRAVNHTEVRTLVKFGLVGGSGYAVNLAVFAVAVHLGAHHIIAATLAFLAAVGNNFHWNRRWTFDAVGAEAIHRQAHRFLIVSVVCFLISLGILQMLITAGVAAVISQAIAILIVTPVGFLGNRLWTFADPGTLRRLAGRRSRPASTDA